MYVWGCVIALYENCGKCEASEMEVSLSLLAKFISELIIPSLPDMKKVPELIGLRH
jgi:hypothetical protein